MPVLVLLVNTALQWPLCCWFCQYCSLKLSSLSLWYMLRGGYGLLKTLIRQRL